MNDIDPIQVMWLLYSSLWLHTNLLRSLVTGWVRFHIRFQSEISLSNHHQVKATDKIHSLFKLYYVVLLWTKLDKFVDSLLVFFFFYTESKIKQPPRQSCFQRNCKFLSYSILKLALSLWGLVSLVNHYALGKTEMYQ